MKFEIKLEGIKETQKMLDDLARKQIPFATAKALNAIAKEVKAAEVQEMKKVFDRPTPFILNGMYIFPALKTRQVVEVGFKDKQAKSIAPHIEGGDRPMKRSEILLGRRWWTPGAGARKNQYGNISSGQITQVLSVLKRSADPYQNITPRSKRRNKKPRDYFMLKWQKGKLRPGVWEKQKSGVKPILMFIDEPQYRGRFHFFKIAQAVVASKWKAIFNEALAQAIRTAR
jgi:hypothetical protein